MGAFETLIESTIARWRGINPLNEAAARLPADLAATITATTVRRDPSIGSGPCR